MYTLYFQNVATSLLNCTVATHSYHCVFQSIQENMKVIFICHLATFAFVICAM